jgi:multiple sugar transport system substrate-binding protein
MFEEAGVEMPPASAENAWTWDEFLEVARKMTLDENGKNALDAEFDSENIVQYGFKFDRWWAVWGTFMKLNGGDYLSADGELAITSPESIEAIQNLADLSNVYHVSPTPVQSESLPGNTEALQTKKIAMAVDGHWTNLNLMDSMSKGQLNYGVGVLPVMKGFPTSQIVAGILSILSDTENLDESWILYKYFVNPESTLPLIKDGLWLPMQKDWYINDEYLDIWARTDNHPVGYEDACVKMMLSYAEPGFTYYVKNFNKINDIINPALDAVWMGEKTAEEALLEVEDAAKAEVMGRR